ncbi:MAG: 1-acyl-sn-glycerol-3-phosphate acyltransferase [Clostridia bacterium]|nr:1-acyl-sn-glycerol-3-phosphate acyltransferase [Clostridia bacterium]
MLFRVIRKLIKGFLHAIFRIKIHGKENCPMIGAVIFALNHKSNWDGLIAATLLPRQVELMAKKELFRVPVIGAIVKWAGAFPVSRGTGDLGAIKAALSILRAEKALVIFPEGHRIKKNQAHSAKAGVALLAEKTGAPIVPVAIRGNYRPFAKIDVFIEEPVYIKGDDGNA